jgi:hypothetical protein
MRTNGGGVIVMGNNNNNLDMFTVTGTNINDVKRQNEHSGLNYNVLNELFEKTTKGLSKEKNSSTKFENDKKKNEQSTESQ